MKKTEAQKREAKREYWRRYYREHKEQIAANQAKYRENMSDAVKDRQREANLAWQSENKEYRAAYFRDYRKNKEQ